MVDEDLETVFPLDKESWLKLKQAVESDASEVVIPTLDGLTVILNLKVQKQFSFRERDSICRRGVLLPDLQTRIALAELARGTQEDESGEHTGSLLLEYLNENSGSFAKGICSRDADPWDRIGTSRVGLSDHCEERIHLDDATIIKLRQPGGFKELNGVFRERSCRESLIVLRPEIIGYLVVPSITETDLSNAEEALRRNRNDQI